MARRSLDEALATAAELGYPVMVKAAAGGGGRGIKVAPGPDELADVLAQAAREADAAFGDASLYLEKLLVGARHVEVQVLGDSHGNVDPPLRARVLASAPAPEAARGGALAGALDPDTRAGDYDAAVRLARSVSYTSAGTIEFLLDASGAFYFIEMNTRIQVEHPVTEMVTGVDLVKEQLRVAAGEALSLVQDDVVLRGAAIELRINAEDADNDFMPSPGRITALELPGGPGVRVDTAIFAGYTIPPFYDSLVAKLIVWGRDRTEAIARARRALQEFRIEGITTTIPFHLSLLDDPRFVAGDYHVDYLERRLAGLEGPI